MSHGDYVLQRRIGALRRTREQLFRKLRAGPGVGGALWSDLEERWKQLEADARHLKRASADAPGGAEDAVLRKLADLGEGYDRLASALREAPRSLGERLATRPSEGFVGETHRAPQRVVGSSRELGRAARRRMAKARLERTHLKRCAELGSRVYELARRPGRFGGGPPRVLDDDQVKAFLRALASLDADLRNAASELPEPDRSEA